MGCLFALCYGLVQIVRPIKGRIKIHRVQRLDDCACCAAHYELALRWDSSFVPVGLCGRLFFMFLRGFPFGFDSRV